MNHTLDLSSRVFTITHEPPDEVPVPIEEISLRDTLIVAQVIIRQFVFRKAQRVLNIKLFRIGGNFRAIVFAANIQPDYLQALIALKVLFTIYHSPFASSFSEA